MSDIVKKIEVTLKAASEYTQEELIVFESFKKELDENDILFTIGDTVVTKDGGFIKIISFFDQFENSWYENGTKKEVPNIEVVKYVVYQEYQGNNNWSGDKKMKLSEIIYYQYTTKLYGTIEDLHKDSMKIITGEIQLHNEEENISDSTDIMLGVSKEILEFRKQELVIKRDVLEAKRRYIHSIMERKTREMHSMVEGFKRQIKKVMRVIQTLELFLGIREDLFQIQEGEKSPVSEPLTFRQQILFMDEELGDPENGGLDINSIEDFDNWLIKPNSYYKKINYELLIPEKKGVVAIKVRRSDKHYHTNPFINSLMNEGNKSVYLLVRNGQNLYRIWSENLSVADKLFPGREEFMELSKNYENSYSEYEKERIDNKVLDYKAHFVMLQGLIDRTDVFTPLLEQINLMSSEPLEKGLVKFIYDDETCLPTGRLSYGEWLKQLNSKIEEGCRIFSSGFIWGYSDRKYEIGARLKRYYRDEYSAPSAPGPGLYTVIEDPDWVFYNQSKDTKTFKFLYTPNNKGLWYTEDVKRGVSFRLTDYDDFYINYDEASLDEIEFYLHNRLDRRFYLSMMPLLVRMRDFKIKELEQESHFVKLVAGQIIKKVEITNLEKLESDIKELIIWWKLKNKWKRAIDSDNQKALRMIIKEYYNKSI
jgi:hypothetical protein